MLQYIKHKTSWASIMNKFFEGNTREWLAYLLVVVFIKVSLWLDSSLVWCIFLYHYGHHEPEQKTSQSEYIGYWLCFHTNFSEIKYIVLRYQASTQSLVLWVVSQLMSDWTWVRNGGLSSIAGRGLGRWRQFLLVFSCM